jgi:hypothetical protein
MATSPRTEKKTSGAIGKEALADTAIVSELKDLGWRAEKVKSGWRAMEVNGDRMIGPATSIKALQTQVNLASGPPAQTKTNGKGNGNGSAAKMPDEIETVEATSQTAAPRLPTMEEPEIDELNLLADRCIDAKAAKEQANAAFKDECDVMRENMRTFKRKRYTRHGFTLTIEDSEKLVIKKAEQAPPKNPGTKKSRTSLGD